MTDARVIVRGVRKVEGLAPRPPLPRAPRQHVGPRPGDPYWQERGWTQSGAGSFTGYYQVGLARFPGRINAKSRVFLINRPPQELRAHPHWICFRYREDGWYAVHFATLPQDMSSGIMEIERILCEALGTTVPKTAQRSLAQRGQTAGDRSRRRPETHDDTRRADRLARNTNAPYGPEGTVAQERPAIFTRSQFATTRPRSPAAVIRSRARKESHDDTRTDNRFPWRWIFIVLIILALFSLLV